MKKIEFILVSVILLISVFSCNKTDLENGYGYLDVYLDRDSEELVFKSEPTEEQVFSVTIYNSLNQKVAFVEDYRELASNPLTLRAGNFEYTAVASCGSDTPAAFDAPFYNGKAAFKISNGKETLVNITCSLSNVKVTTDFEGIKEYFKEYEFTVSNGLGELVFSNVSEPATAEKEGFFSVADALYWSLKVVNNDGVEYKAMTGSCENVKANQHYNFKFSLKEAEDGWVDGAGAITVIINDSMNEESIDLPLDFGDETVPEMSSNFAEDGEPVTITAGDATEKKVSLAAEDGFKSVRLSYGPAEAMTKASRTTYELVGASNEIISALALEGINVASVAEGSKSVDVTLTSYIKDLAMGSYSISFFMVDMNNAYTEKTIELNVLSDVDVEAVSVSPWAKFATVEAKWFPAQQPEGLSFQYRKNTETEWTDFAGQVSVNAQSRTYSADITGLEPETAYVFRAVTSQDKETKTMDFTTESAGTIPNMNFDSWYQDGGAWYPNSGSDNFYWDSANGGTKTINIYPTTPAETEHIYAGANAAKLESKNAALVGLAAGNIYTGKFVKAVMSFTNPGAQLDWGVPFTSRPLGLTGYFKYFPETVDKGEHNGMFGKTDIGQIQIMLTDWETPFRINTAEQKFVNPDTDTGIIAYGTMDLNETQDYTKFTIKLDYRDKTRTPKYIVIVAAASKYGDYFTGGVGSTLYLDEFEFVYDPDSL